MGVKDLWQVLAPVSERKSLWELQDRTIAVDLSGWVCDSQNVAEYSTQPNMHLRNLFFRTSCLLLLGARPVFVLEGDAPSLKLNVMSQRNAQRGLSNTSKNSGQRKRYKTVQKKCEEMLQCMGVKCIQSPGEAEALCAILNAKGMVDGCISQDSDCFLYGAQVVYRNFTISASSGGGGGQGFSIDMYRMEQIEKLLGLSRTKLVGLSLLCGCDYNQGGVSGVGKETAVKFLSTLRDDEVFARFVRWKNDPAFEMLERERTCGLCDKCGHLGKKRIHDKNGCELCQTSKNCLSNSQENALHHRDPEERRMLVNELNIRKKALQDDSFPSQDVIDEFYCIRKVPKDIQWEWSQPNLILFMKLAEKHLKWDESYSLEKFLPLVTRWLLLHSKNSVRCPIYPEAIVKTRVLKGVASYEVKWSDREGLFETLVHEDSSNMCLTIEPKELFEKAFPDLVLKFNDEEQAKKMAKLKCKTSKKKTAKVQTALSRCSDCGKQLPAKNQSCMCQFVKITAVEKEKTSPQRTLEDLLSSLKLNAEEKKEDPPESKVKTKSSKVLKNSQKLKKLLEGGVFSAAEQSFSSTTKNYQLECKYQENNKVPQMPQSSKKSSKAECKEGSTVSFETLLENEGWEIEDFLKEEEVDLSDIVQSITGKSTTEKGESNFEKGSSSPNWAAESLSNGDDRVQTSMPRSRSDEETSDEDTPYTPLIERVQKLQERDVGTRRSSVLSSIQARRFSESFYAFSGGEKAASSPKYDTSQEACLPSDESRVTFSLGITRLLEDTV